MKCYRIFADYGCPTHTGCFWRLKQDDSLIPRQHKQWDPVDDAMYAEGPRGWLANGPLTEDSVERLRKLWAHAPGRKCH